MVSLTYCCLLLKGRCCFYVLSVPALSFCLQAVAEKVIKLTRGGVSQRYEDDIIIYP